VNFTFSSGWVYGRAFSLGFNKFSDGPDGALNASGLFSLVSFAGTSSSGLNSRRFQKS